VALFTHFRLFSLIVCDTSFTRVCILTAHETPSIRLVTPSLLHVCSHRCCRAGSQVSYQAQLFGLRCASVHREFVNWKRRGSLFLLWSAAMADSAPASPVAAPASPGPTPAELSVLSTPSNGDSASASEGPPAGLRPGAKRGSAHVREW
jgi:hypothetical protein